MFADALRDAYLDLRPLRVISWIELCDRVVTAWWEKTLCVWRLEAKGDTYTCFLPLALRTLGDDLGMIQTFSCQGINGFNHNNAEILAIWLQRAPCLVPLSLAADV